MNAMTAPTRDVLLRLPDVMSATGLSRSTIYRRIKTGEFPDAYSLGGPCVAWRRSEVEKWIEDRCRRVPPS
ncbi:MAG: AlpA family transcriptional regulator [Sphingobium limneticum]